MFYQNITAFKGINNPSEQEKVFRSKEDIWIK